MFGRLTVPLRKWLATGVLILLSLCLCQAQIGGNRSEIKIIDNGYEGILIAIENNVAENPTLIERIKEHFTAASQLLFTATKRRAYFRHITILIPDTWTGVYDPADTEDYSAANIIIHANGSNLQPRTRQFEGCGKGGDQIFLLSDHINTLTSDLQGISASFPHDGTIVHEWAHLRWGVFDEYPLNGEPRFYLDNNNNNGPISPVKCGKHLKGTIGMGMTLNGEPTGSCSINSSTNLPDSNCIFVADKDNPGVTASLMNVIVIPDITEFCDNDRGNPDTLHNEDAPNRQNIHCDGLSVWEVMRYHSDFINDANLPVNNLQHDTTPEFKVVKATPYRTVFILDFSLSIKFRGLLDRLRHDATSFLLNRVPYGSYVGIVTFGTTAEIKHAVSLVQNAEDIDSLIDALPDQADGRTCIGCAMKLAVQALEQAGLGTAGAMFLLLSDGSENEDPRIEAVFPTIQEKGIKVDAFLYTEFAEPTLTTLAKQTGGLVFFDSGLENSTALLNGFLATVAQRQQPTSSSLPSQVALQSFKIEAQDEAILTIALDSTVGNNTRFSFTYNPGTAPLINVAVTSPSEEIFLSNGPQASRRADVGLLLITIPGTAEPGMWNVTIKNTAASLSATTQILVVSAPVLEIVNTYRVTATVKHGAVDFRELDLDNPVVIYAEVSQGHIPVIRANVTAVITLNNTEKRLPLLDNGVGSDLFRDDGIYSAYFVQFSGDGKYAVQIEVSSTNGTAISDSHVSSPAPDPDQSTNTDSTVPDAFQRSTSAGFMSVDNHADKPDDLYPPSRVTDLAVVEVVDDEMTLRLRWTAVGDDLDQGQASRYEIRHSTSINELRDIFEKSDMIEEHQVVGGSLFNVQPSMAEENMQLKMSSLQESTNYYFALKVWDDDGRTSETSNIVSVVFFSTQPTRHALSTTVIVVIVLGCVLTTAVIATVSVFLFYKYHHARNIIA